MSAETRTGFNTLFLAALLLGYLSALYYFFGWPIAILGFVGGTFFYVWLLQRGTGALADWAHALYWGQWEGEYLHYDYHHFRAYRIDDELWIVARDIAKGLKVKRYDERGLKSRLVGTTQAKVRGLFCVNVEGLRLYLDQSKNAIGDDKCRRWLETNVIEFENKQAERRRLGMITRR